MPPSLTNIVAVRAGANHSLALKLDGTVAAWGINSAGQGSAPVWLTNVTSIATGDNHNLALLGYQPAVGQLEILQATRTIDGVELCVQGSESGRVREFEYCTSLSRGDWRFWRLAPGKAGPATVTDLEPQDSQRFYRVREWP